MNIHPQQSAPTIQFAPVFNMNGAATQEEPKQSDAVKIPSGLFSSGGDSEPNQHSEQNNEEDKPLQTTDLSQIGGSNMNNIIIKKV